MAVTSKNRQVQEIIKCGKDPIYFLNNYMKIQHPIKGLIKFDTFDFQDECVESFIDNRFSVILKSRQLGMSTLIAAYSVWLALFQKDKNILVIATKLSVAQNFMTKIKVMIRSLPPWLVLPQIVSNNKQLIEFSHGSTIKAIPTSDDAGRSEALSLLIVDEAAFIRNFDEIWTGLYPTLSTGGRAIVLSTPNGVGGQYYKLYTDAVAQVNEFNPIKIPWDAHPERDEEWFKETTRNLSDRQISQEYLCDFASSGDTYLSSEDIEWIRQNIIPPVERRGFDRNVWIWKYPLSEHQYIMSADVARGDSKDYSTFHIIDTNISEVVAEYRGKIPPDRFAELLDEFGRMYNNALLCPENNSFGYATILKLQDLAYPSLYYKKRKAVYIGGYVPEKERDLAGFTTSGKTRGLILTKLEEILRNKQIMVYSSRFYEELKTFTWVGNKAKAMKGYNDDLVMSFAIGCWIFDASDAYSQNSRLLNESMIKGMKLQRNTYDELPEAVVSGRPFKSEERDPRHTSGEPKGQGSSGWGKKINVLSEFDWVYK